MNSDACTYQALILALMRELECAHAQVIAYQEHQARQDRILGAACNQHLVNAQIVKCSRCKVYLELFRLEGLNASGVEGVGATACQICEKWVCYECESKFCNNDSCDNKFLCTECVGYSCEECYLDICVACVDKPQWVKREYVCEKCAVCISTPRAFCVKYM